jgi:hypothetical protein
MKLKEPVQYTKQKMKIASTILLYWNKMGSENTSIS